VDFVVGDVVRQGFGFANPNHAAAAISAAFPFCWGWRGAWRWAGRLVAVALYAMLAVTCSRTGTLVDYGGRCRLARRPSWERRSLSPPRVASAPFSDLMPVRETRRKAAVG